MLLEIAAWVLIVGVSSAIGAGVLTLLGARRLRAGDRFILAAWTGLVVLSIALLAVSIAVPLSPGAALTTAGVLAVTGALLSVRARGPGARPPDEAPVPRRSVATGAALIVVAAAALASDAVTLYDSLVYHVGIMRWLHEYGTVPGVALIHNRLGHVSAWFALSAPFDAGLLSDRNSNIGLGVVLVLVAGQAAIATARIVARIATRADWFLALSSLALIWPVLAYDAASPSPDVATNALLVVVAWSMLLAVRAGTPRRGKTWERLLNPCLVPFVLAVGAMSMKLVALPAAVVAALFYVMTSFDHSGARAGVARVGVCAALGLVLVAPLVAANVVSSGCPLFPSPIGCVDASWSIGAGDAAQYAEYIRNVARFENRQSGSTVAPLPWLGMWVRAHWLLTPLIAITPALIILQLRGPKRHGVRGVLSIAALGIPFSMWLAPAPRFVYAYLVIVIALVAAFPLARWARHTATATEPLSAVMSQRLARLGFVGFAVTAAAAYALASQKLNVRSGLMRRGALTTRSALLAPGSPEQPARLYRWRVNDVEFFTPVPRPVVDTLGYLSDIDGDVGFEKCSTSPLPCTPYLPRLDVRLRDPSRGIAGGFERLGLSQTGPAPAPECLGELSPPFHRATMPASAMTPNGDGGPNCGKP